MDHAEALAKALEAGDDLCPVCAVPFKAGDACATDIELGECHAECLEGSPVVDLDTGDPSDGPITTYAHEPLSPDPRALAASDALAKVTAERDEIALRAATIDEALTNAIHLRRAAEAERDRLATELAAYRSRPAAEVVTEEMVREIWDHATNATCQTLQDKGMCNCPDGGCVAATVVPEMADLIYHCTLATPPAAGTEPAGEVVDARLCKLRFFRDLIESERVKVYKVFGVLPSDFDERLNHGIESKLFKHLVAALREQSEA